MEILSRETHKSSFQNIRPYNVIKDLGKVADLVEVCFANTLDADSKRYLNHMQNVAKDKISLRWARFIPELANLPLTGFVWEEDGKLVGNITLIPYYVKGKRFFLIANVAVHPEFRRRRIAHLLTLHAMEYIKQQGVSSVWLHARDENPHAINLYSRLGFSKHTRRTSWISDNDGKIIQIQNKNHIGSLKKQHWNSQRKWIIANYPPELSWYMPLNIHNLNPDIFGFVYRILMNNHVVQWGYFQNNQLLGAVSWQESSNFANNLWLAVPPNSDESVVTQLLIHARYYAPSSRPMKLNFQSDQYAEAIQQAGFSKQQTLIWMSYTFPPKKNSSKTWK